MFTSNSVIDEIKIDDRTVEVIGYVDSIESPKTVGQLKKYKLLKFSLNNNNGRKIQCLAWEDQVERAAKEIQLNKIIYLDGAHSKKVEKAAFNTGNVPFELNIASNTVINDLGNYDMDSLKGSIVDVDFQDIADTQGNIRIEGYIKSMFAVIKSKDLSSSYGIGSITDGTMKLEIRITSMKDLPTDLKKGDCVRIMGVVRHASHIYVQVTDGRNIYKINDKYMTLDEMINVTQSPEKRQRLE